MNHRHSVLVAAAVLLAAPVAAQNAIETIDNAAADVGAAASNVGEDIANGASSVADTADNAVDIDVTTDDALTSPTDGNIVVDDTGLATDPTMEGNMVTTTTMTTTRQDGGKGNWGLLGLAGLLAFLFRPKKPDIILDERTDRSRI